jgi:hypothetical protein
VLLLVTAWSERPVKVFFANSKYSFVDERGKLRVRVLRNSVCVKGLPRPE